MRVQFSNVRSTEDDPSKKMVTFSNFCLRANMYALPQKHVMASGDDATQKLELAPRIIWCGFNAPYSTTPNKKALERAGTNWLQALKRA